jgi:hypothetical protein
MEGDKQKKEEEKRVHNGHLRPSPGTALSATTSVLLGLQHFLKKRNKFGEEKQIQLLPFDRHRLVIFHFLKGHFSFRIPLAFYHFCFSPARVSPSDFPGGRELFCVTTFLPVAGGGGEKEASTFLLGLLTLVLRAHDFTFPTPKVALSFATLIPSGRHQMIAGTFFLPLDDLCRFPPRLSLQV